MKITEILNVVKPQYIFIKLKPNNSIRNNQTHLIARTISTLYKKVNECLKREEEKVLSLFKKDIFIGTKYSLQQQGKVSYYVYMEKGKIEFYFIIPKHHLSIVEEKISDVWKGITIDKVEEIPTFSESAYKYQMVYEKEDGLSLQTNRANNDLLNSNLNVVDVMEEGDKVGILYNFIPSSQGSFKHSYKATMEKVKKGVPTERNKLGAGYIVKMGVSLVDMIINDITEAIAGKKKEKQEESVLEGLIDRLNGGKEVSESTQKKIKGQILDTQILVFSESEDKTRERNNATSLAQSFDVISGDNKLVPKRVKKKVNIMSKKMSGIEVNKVGDEEAQNFIGIAGREILERYSFIEKIETQETQVPQDLREGVMCIGDNIYRGMKQPAYLSNDREFRNLLTLLIGPTRAGKSTLIANLCKNAIDNGECALIFDFIENCELSDEVIEVIGRDKTLEIKVDDSEMLQGLGYNEVGFSEDVFKQYENAKRQTANLLALVNSINVSDNPLTPKMERYLESASLCVFISGGSIKDVFGVLQNHELRAEWVEKVPKNQTENLQDYLDSLRELDKLNNAGEVIGTNYQAGIIDRLNTLKRNTYMELMLKKSTENNIDLVEEMQKNQLITIKMPQSMFTTDGEKDICTTYWISKIWLALQVRADKIRDKSKRTKVNLVIDELYQVSHTEQFLTSKLSQIAKFICKPIVSCHYINQLKYMREELRSANTSYMLIAGCDKKNFEELKDELYPYTAEDLKNLKRYHSLNYIKNTEGYARFITKLPAPVKPAQEITVNGEVLDEVAVTKEDD